MQEGRGASALRALPGPPQQRGLRVLGRGRGEGPRVWQRRQHLHITVRYDTPHLWAEVGSGNIAQFNDDII